mmetsp:Transcript_11453/g.39831  ORF Transcript_11453/g.39831 Transcript_11453/m.39831 type:complete len:246 (-) Transcript_11453:1626-2363(-)
MFSSKSDWNTLPMHDAHLRRSSSAAVSMSSLDTSAAEMEMGTSLFRSTLLRRSSMNPFVTGSCSVSISRLKRNTPSESTSMSSRLRKSSARAFMCEGWPPAIRSTRRTTSSSTHSPSPTPSAPLSTFSVDSLFSGSRHMRRSCGRSCSSSAARLACVGAMPGPDAQTTTCIKEVQCLSSQRKSFQLNGSMCCASSITSTTGLSNCWITCLTKLYSLSCTRVLSRRLLALCENFQNTEGTSCCSSA